MHNMREILNKMFKKKCTNPLNQEFFDHFNTLKKTAEYFNFLLFL